MHRSFGGRSTVHERNHNLRMVVVHHHYDVGDGVFDADADALHYDGDGDDDDLRHY